MWEPNPGAHTVTVREPSKQKKFKGIKTFTAYQVVPSSTGKAVSRRYKHYDWLHSRLEEKFTINSVPPLPDKQYYGKELLSICTCTCICGTHVHVIYILVSRPHTSAIICA